MPTLTDTVEVTVTEEVEITQKTDVEIEFEVYCETCNAGMCNQSEVVRTHNRGQLAVRVTVCEMCRKKAWDDGYEAGHEAGYNEARREFEE